MTEENERLQRLNAVLMKANAELAAKLDEATESASFYMQETQRLRQLISTEYAMES